MSGFLIFSTTNGKYIEEPKYLHNVSVLEEQKYTNCHIDDQTMKQHQPQYNATTASSASSSSTPSGIVNINCHTTTATVNPTNPDEHNDNNNIGVIKTEDGVTHSYVLPPFLH